MDANAKLAARTLCTNVIQQRTRHDSEAIDRRTETDTLRSSKAALHALLDTTEGGALRTEAGDVLRLKNVPSRLRPTQGLLENAVNGSDMDTLQVGLDADAALPWQRMADSVFVNVKALMFPRRQVVTVCSSCPRGVRRESLPLLPRSHAPLLETYVDTHSTCNQRRKRSAAAMCDVDTAPHQLVDQLRAVGGALRYSLTVDGARRSATLSLCPSKSTELLVGDVRAAVNATAEARLGRLADHELARLWASAAERRAFAAATLECMEATRTAKRAAAPLCVRLTDIK